LHQLDDRQEYTRQVFLELCERTSLVDLAGKDRSWAIIGGAVRDTLLSPKIGCSHLFELWPDIDIAVTHDVSELPVAAGSSNDRSITISPNSFGGLKIREPKLGVIDFWTWTTPKNHGSTANWLEELERVDFGMNAVAFVWPQREVIIHRRWIQDLRTRRIEKVSPQSPKTSIQVVRAIALKVKLQLLVNQSFGLGTNIRQDLQWLVKDAPRAEVTQAIHYMIEKTTNSRWPIATLERFLRVSRAYRQSVEFDEAILEVWGDRFSRSIPRKPKNKLQGRTSHQTTLDL